MSWNLQWRERADWWERQPAILATLEAVRPDVAGLQEVWSTTDTTLADELADRLGLHAAFAAPSLPPPPDPPDRPDQAGVEVGIAVLSRWPILEARSHPLPSHHRPEVVALAVVADHPAGPLHVVTTCLDWEPRLDSRRPAQARALAALLTDPARDGPLPVLLTGDLNTPPAAPEIRLLTEVATDAWPAANPDPADPGHTSAPATPSPPGPPGSSTTASTTSSPAPAPRTPGWSSSDRSSPATRSTASTPPTTTRWSRTFGSRAPPAG